MERIRDDAVRLRAMAPATVHRYVASAWLHALDGDAPGGRADAVSIASTARWETDTRAAKVVSRKYRFLWIANCKVASRSMLHALCAADPTARMVRGITVSELLRADPPIAEYTSFAFVRHPYSRALSFQARVVEARRNAKFHRDTIAPWHGLESSFGFAETCRWLATPWGSDHFGDRHWVSQAETVRIAGGLPDFLGSFEKLQEDRQRIMDRLGVPCGRLPHLNASAAKLSAEVSLDAHTRALLRRRYSGDFGLGGYDS